MTIRCLPDHQVNRKNGLRTTLRWMAVLVVLLLTVQIGLIEAAQYLLVARTPLKAADAIVVLGGESQQRADRAAELYHDGLAPLVIVSGFGDCQQMADRLGLDGVSAFSILIECQSRNTSENAVFSSTLLHSWNVSRIIVVTSWFHSQRALLCFRRSFPGMEVLVEWSNPPPQSWRIIGRTEGKQVIMEYLKTVWYWLPFGSRCTGA
jgi:uncharacterized SAM-binding protein YcdF (DUF218 family)